MTNALVLAGGGVAGLAWELGVLRGIADADPGLADRIVAADLVVGTSAGSAVAAQITSGTPLDVLYQAQLAEETGELEPDVDFPALIQQLGAALTGGGDQDELRRRVGALALAASTVAPGLRRAAIAARLPRDTWPEQRIQLPAVDVGTGRSVVFDRESGVSLADAVAASCAVPGVWPPVEIDGRRYMDGGLRSGTNGDLAAGAARILVIQPALADAPALWGPTLAEEIDALKPAEVHAINADQASIDAFGPNPLSPATRAASARAGFAIGRAQAAEVAAFWI
ncbi:patatin-like phospholipase family protein [Actinoplanes sp. NPDC051494]|uniref:patatin-like phospholipase family protein n=1 Tax=Actinoplanes sp. NPDC051494 TaxID=3363907 RepID=UPI0037A51A90